jgi:hypothetical protein
VAWSSAEEDGEWGVGSDLTSTVVAVAGLYLVTSSVFRGARASSAVFRVAIQGDGNDLALTDADASAAARGACAVWCGQVAAGVALTTVITNNGGATLAVEGSHMTVVRIGPVRWT